MPIKRYKDKLTILKHKTFIAFTQVETFLYWSALCHMWQQIFMDSYRRCCGNYQHMWKGGYSLLPLKLKNSFVAALNTITNCNCWTWSNFDESMFVYLGIVYIILMIVWYICCQFHDSWYHLLLCSFFVVRQISL